MKVPKKEDIPHKLALYKLLTELLSNAFIANKIYFKGETCAAMLGYLDRFSVDLDFDLPDKQYKNKLRPQIHQIFKKINFQIKDESPRHLQFFLKYRNTAYKRNSLKLEITDIVSPANEYEKVYLPEIDKYCQAQTIETMFANKLIALKARFDEDKGLAGRDLYDISYFFKQGYQPKKEIIVDRRQTSFKNYIKELISFVNMKVSEKVLWQDLNPLMNKKQLHQAVPYLKNEVLQGLKAYL